MGFPFDAGIDDGGVGECPIHRFVWVTDKGFLGDGHLCADRGAAVGVAYLYLDWEETVGVCCTLVQDDCDFCHCICCFWLGSGLVARKLQGFTRFQMCVKCTLFVPCFPCAGAGLKAKGKWAVHKNRKQDTYDSCKYLVFSMLCLVSPERLELSTH